MMRRLDKVWYCLLDKAHRWIAGRVVAHCMRNMMREAEMQRRHEAMRRLDRIIAPQKYHLN